MNTQQAALYPATPTRSVPPLCQTLESRPILRLNTSEQRFQTFEIYVANELSAQDVSISIRIDGTFIGRYFLTGQGKNVLPGLYVSDSVTKPFCFRQLKIPGESPRHRMPAMKASLADDADQMNRLCAILVISSGRTWASWNFVYIDAYARAVTSFGRRTSRNPRWLARKELDRARSLRKAWRESCSKHRPTQLSLNVLYSTGPERPIPKIEGVQGVTIDPPNEPFARVIFRYRPRGAWCPPHSLQYPYAYYPSGPAGSGRHWLIAGRAKTPSFSQSESKPRATANPASVTPTFVSDTL